MQLGINLDGPLKKAQGSRKNLIVAMNYVSRWIKVKPLTRITRVAVKYVVWTNIICRFGIPHTILIDNGL